MTKSYHKVKKNIYCSTRGDKSGDFRRIRLCLVYFICAILTSCTIQKQTHITIIIMAKKNLPPFYTKYNRHLYSSPGLDTGTEHNVQPGEAISMAEMLRMSARGEIPPMAKAAFHGHDVDMDEIDGTLPQDITDVENKARELQALEAAQAAKKAERSSTARSKETGKQRSGETGDQTPSIEETGERSDAEQSDGNEKN